MFEVTNFVSHFAGGKFQVTLPSNFCSLVLILNKVTCSKVSEFNCCNYKEATMYLLYYCENLTAYYKQMCVLVVSFLLHNAKKIIK